MADIKLGDEIKDVTVDMTGIAIARLEYLDGHKAWLMQPAAVNNTELPQKIEVEDAYAVKIGDGVYIEPKPPLGFNARQVTHDSC